MEKIIAVISIIVENTDKSSEINNILHSYADNIVGRLGLPYTQRNMNIICVVVDGTKDIVLGLSEKIGAVDGVKVEKVCATC